MVGAQYSGPPVKVAIFGDSVAWRLGFAMLASQPQNTYDVNIDNGAIVGCGVVLSTSYRAHGVPDTVTPACNTSAPQSEQWPAQWRGDLEPVPSERGDPPGRPVGGRGPLIGGHWLHIGDPAFDAELKASLEQAVQVGTSTGALMVLMTSPCFDSGEQDNGLPWPEDSATRLAEYNAMVRQVAAEHPATVQLDDFDALLCPGGAFTTSFDGIQIRDGDGVHIVPTAAAGQWLDAELLPEVIKGRQTADGRAQLTCPTTSTSSSPPPPGAVATQVPGPEGEVRAAGPGHGDDETGAGGGIDDGGGGWLKVDWSAGALGARAGTRVVSGTRLLSDTVVIRACHWPSW